MIRYKVCIIGCGDIGFLFDHNKKSEGALSHFKAFNDSEKFELAAVADSRQEIRDLIKTEHEVNVYEDYKKMCEDKKPDVIVIATNDESHFEILKDITEYKPKLVFCEKPLTLDYREVKDIVGVYKKNEILLQVNYTRRFLDEFYEIEKIIKENGIGKIESVTMYYSRGLIHNASHYLDLINWYIGETEKNIYIISRKDGLHKIDDTVSFDMIYESGTEVRFIGLSPSKLSFAEVDFIGTEGRIKINYRNEIEKYRVSENKIFSGYSSYELYETKPIQYHKALPNAAENIYNSLSKGESLKSPAENSLKIFEITNRIGEK